MATKTSQRVFIWVIAIVMAIGTLGAYFGIILANNNQAADTARQQQQQEELYRKLLAEQRKSLKPLDGYSAEPFDKNLGSLQVEELKPGSGGEIKDAAKLTVNYFGWLPDGTIFDSTNKDGQTAPIDQLTLEQGKIIEGWRQGLIGRQVGGTYKLLIPAGMAYGSQGSQGIDPDTPLAFIVEVQKAE